MSTLARTPVERLEEAWGHLDPRPAFTHLRAPETGLLMVRGRAGGSGALFNLGEVPVTRCAVKIENRRVGTSYVMGRDPRHAELAALFDALLQEGNGGESGLGGMLKQFERELSAEDNRGRARVEETRVEFFTMVRGE